MKLQSIQFLRALAALLVVYAHSIDLQMSYSGSVQQHFYFLQNFGAVGVDIFFVLSGFIICYTAHADSGLKDGLRFLEKRFIRINPVYYIATLLYFIPYLFHFWKNGQAPSLPPGTILKTILILPFTDRTCFIFPLLAIGWTLSFEWFFYILFYILIIARARHKPLWLLLIMASLVLIGLLIGGHAAPPDYRLIFISNPVILEFLSGVLICWGWLHLQIPKSLAGLLVAAALGIFGYELFAGFGGVSEAQDMISGKLAMTRLMAWGIPSALLVAGCVGLEKNGSAGFIWNNRPAGLTGDASYSIYLTHLTVFQLFNLLYLRLGFFLNPDLAIILQVVLAAGAGILFYKFVEAPLLKSMRASIASS
jgi:exopolysaccharide production protein ExoZ